MSRTSAATEAVIGRETAGAIVATVVTSPQHPQRKAESTPSQA